MIRGSITTSLSLADYQGHHSHKLDNCAMQTLGGKSSSFIIRGIIYTNLISSLVQGCKPLVGIVTLSHACSCVLFIVYDLAMLVKVNRQCSLRLKSNVAKTTVEKVKPSPLQSLLKNSVRKKEKQDPPLL